MPLVLRLASFVKTCSGDGGAESRSPAWVSVGITPSTTAKSAIQFLIAEVQKCLRTTLHAPDPSAGQTPAWVLCLRDVHGAFHYSGSSDDDGEAVRLMDISFLADAAAHSHRSLRVMTSSLQGEPSRNGKRLEFAFVRGAVLPLEILLQLNKGAKDLRHLDVVRVPPQLTQDPPEPVSTLPKGRTRVPATSLESSLERPSASIVVPSPSPALTTELRRTYAQTRHGQSLHTTVLSAARWQPIIVNTSPPKRPAEVVTPTQSSSRRALTEAHRRFREAQRRFNELMLHADSDDEGTRSELLVRRTQLESELAAYTTAQRECEKLTVLVDFYERELAEAKGRNHGLQSLLQA